MAQEMITPQELKEFIDYTQKVEKDFYDLQASFAYLQDTVEKVVEFLPNAIWILDKDNAIFLQNSKASDLYELFELLELEKDDYEITHNGRSYLIKSSVYQDKKMLSATDITEQKRKESLATMGQMAAHLSHEIRNPIGSISLLSSTLKKRVMEKNIPIVEEIQKSVYRVERIINAMLTFSKGIKINKKSFLWSELRESIDMDIEYYSCSKEIKFLFPTKDFMLNGDKHLLGMLFSNFIINAIDAIELDEEKEEGEVEVIYNQDEEYHIFHIYDNGIPIENKEDLFEAFKSSKVKGNGLGLVLARQIAQAHGGDVYLLDEAKKGFGIKFKRF
ncbi:Flagellar sensory histidine kinase FlgS [hydrothermal vent metagenome]|uniref:Flagellar sensory histidine kinase FlgS n=1 Tax=hydrothermal vent metagenome TaxID=652676 RepID=A0A1W1D3I5_9ZZZZ